MYRKLLPWHIDPNDKAVCIKEIQTTQIPEDKLTLLNWNVHKNNHHFKWLHDFGHILHHHAPNLIAFQEYKTISKRSILDSHKDYGYGFFPNIQMYGKDYGILSAATCNFDHCNPIRTDHVEPLIKTPKISLYTRYKLLNNKTLTLINTHMINFVQMQKYLSQIKQLESLIDESDCLILTGDFNTWNTKRMHILDQMTKNMGLEQVAFEYDHHKKSYLAHPLDHIFFKGLQQTASHVLHEVKSSDHKPILADFMINP